MVLDGLVHAGNVKLNGQALDFSYEAFTIDFNKIEEAQLKVSMTPKTSTTVGGLKRMAEKQPPRYFRAIGH